MKLIKCTLALALCLSLAVLPALGSEGFPKTIVDSANRAVIPQGVLLELAWGAVQGYMGVSTGELKRLIALSLPFFKAAC